jgi:hypothetical protein
MKDNIITSLKTNEILISKFPIIPFCQGCQKLIKTMQENQNFLGKILPTIKNQLLIEEKPKIIFPTNQDKPEA